MNQFAIISPVLGLKLDMPSILIDDAFTADHANVAVVDGTVRRMLAPDVHIGYAVPDGQAVQRFYWYKRDEGDAFLLAFTKLHIYSWDPVGNGWVERFTSAGHVAHWSVTTYNNRCVVANHVDMVLVWNGSDARFGNLGGDNGILFKSSEPQEYITRARYCTEFSNNLLLLHETKNGTTYPFDIIWSVQGEWTFDSVNDGAGNVAVDGADKIVGTAKVADYLIVFKERSIWRMWQVGGDLVFNMAKIIDGISCPSELAACTGESGELYFFSTDKRIRVTTGSPGDVQAISDAIDPILKTVRDGCIDRVRLMYSKKTDCLLVSIPANGSDNNNMILSLNRKGAWTRLNIAASALVEYEEKQVWTIDNNPYNQPPNPYDNSLDAVPNTITLDYDDNLSLNRNELFASPADSKFRRLFVSTSQVSEADKAYFVLSTDLNQGGGGLASYKRLVRFKPIFRNPNGATITIKIRCDMVYTNTTQYLSDPPTDVKPDWQPITRFETWDYEKNCMKIVSKETFVLKTEQDFEMLDIPCSWRAKTYDIRIESRDMFEFVGAFFEYTEAGLR